MAPTRMDALPDWTSKDRGVHVKTAVHVKAAAKAAGTSAAASEHLALSRNRVSVLKPGASRVDPEDDFEVDACFGQGSGAREVHDKSVRPLIHKLLQGYNVCVVLFGATDSAKGALVDGAVEGDDVDGDAGKGGPSEGLVHLAAAEIFRALSTKTRDIVDYMARHAASAGGRGGGGGGAAAGFDFHVQSSYAEVYNERARDCYAPREDRADLPVVADPALGFRAQGQAARRALDAQELCRDFDRARRTLDDGLTDIGRVEERRATLFSIGVDQLIPSAYKGHASRAGRQAQGSGNAGAASGAAPSAPPRASGASDHFSHLQSRLTFVNLPGAERLLMDPEVLRAREGVSLNKGLLNFARCLRRLSGVEGGKRVAFLAEESVLTKMAHECLGGNAYCLVVAALRAEAPGDWQQNLVTLRYASAVARRVRTFPTRNDSMSRELMRQLRVRLIKIGEERDALIEDLRDAPADYGGGGEGGGGASAAAASHRARAHHLERVCAEERRRAAGLLEEVRALEARLEAAALSDQEVSTKDTRGESMRCDSPLLPHPTPTLSLFHFLRGAPVTKPKAPPWMAVHLHFN